MAVIKYPVDANKFILSQHFKARELECHCGCKKLIIVPRLLVALEATRSRLMRPLVVNNGVRCVMGQRLLYEQINLNRRLAGLRPLRIPKIGYHVTAEAIDTASIKPPMDSDDDAEFIEELRGDGWKGIGIQREKYDSQGKLLQVGWVHLDVRLGDTGLWYYGVGRPSG